jgi:hypothetical protein
MPPGMPPCLPLCCASCFAGLSGLHPCSLRLSTALGLLLVVPCSQRLGTAYVMLVVVLGWQGSTLAASLQAHPVETPPLGTVLIL